MKRQTWVILGGTVAFAVVAAACWAYYVQWRKRGHEEASVAFSSLAVCLAGGPERVSAEAASRHARLLHYTVKDPSLAWCVPFKNALTSSRYVRFEYRYLAEELQQLNLGPFEKRPVWDLKILWLMGEGFSWQPPTMIGGAPVSKPPVTVVDPVLSAESATDPSFEPVKLEVNLDPYPRNHIVVGKERSSDMVVVNEPGQPFARLERRPKDTTPPPPRLLIPGHRSERLSVLDNYAMWIAGTDLHVRHVPDRKDIVLNLPGKEAFEVNSCRAPSRRVVGVGVGKKTALILYEFRENGITNIGRIENASHTAVITCDDDVVRVAWANADPPGRATPDDRGAVDIPPGGHQQIHVATCSKGTCTQKDARIALNVGWAAMGGYGADWYMKSAQVHPVGDRLLILWEQPEGLFYRFAPLEELETTPDGWFAESVRSSFEAQRTPFTIENPELQIFLRGDAALVRVKGTCDKKPCTVFVRFEANGKIAALPFPELPR